MRCSKVIVSITTLAVAQALYTCNALVGLAGQKNFSLSLLMGIPKQKFQELGRDNFSRFKHPGVLFAHSDDVDNGNDGGETANDRNISILSESQAIMTDGLLVKPIGVVRSIYKLCVGTPRQGLLAPNARGYIDLFALGNSSPYDSVSGLEDFSHIWVVFIFHLNTQSKNASKRIKSKISPPALGGEKVGIYATRTPHRFNPVGMTLCKLDRIHRIDKRNVRLYISGLDLVDGTPVLDIKPYVPIYDSVPDYDLRVPSWVEGGLALKRPVTFSEDARDQLKSILTRDPDTLRFYGQASGDATAEETILECIQEVLAIDVRSSYQTKKSRDGRYRAEQSKRFDLEVEPSDSHCTQQVDNLLVHFNIEEVQNPSKYVAQRSGAEDTIVVTKIEQLAGR